MVKSTCQGGRTNNTETWCLSSYTHTHTRTHAHAHTHMHTYTHTPADWTVLYDSRRYIAYVPSPYL